MMKPRAAVDAPTTQSPRATNNARVAPSGQQSRRASGSRGGGGVSNATGEVDKVNVLVKQPETRPIGQERLVAEVKGIYAGLVMVENECIEVDNAQNSLNNYSASPKLNNDQWQALIGLHRTLLHEHHDFFLASQHPSASPALRRLAYQIAQIGMSEDADNKGKEGRWITYDADTTKFRPAAQDVSDVEIRPPVTKATYEDVLPEEPTLSVKEQENEKPTIQSAEKVRDSSS